MRSALHSTQKLHAGMPEYISKSEVDGLKDPKNSLAKKVKIMAERLCKLGITKPDEKTFAWAVGIVVLCHFQDYPKYKHVFAILGEMKADHKATNIPWPFSWTMSDYPMHPYQLPQLVLEHAYDKEDPPQGISLRYLKYVVKRHVPLRQTSMLLRKESLGASLDGLNMDATGPDPKEKKVN